VPLARRAAAWRRESTPGAPSQSRDPNKDLLVISADGKGIVMRHEDLREGTKRAAEKSSCVFRAIAIRKRFVADPVRAGVGRPVRRETRR
jgi:hypothetical protein